MVVVITVVVEVRVTVDPGKVVDTVVVYRELKVSIILSTHCSVLGVRCSYKQKVISPPRTQCRAQGTMRQGKKVLRCVRT